MFRELMGRLSRGDMVLADRFYCSYFMICLLMELGVDFVVRLHQRRTADLTGHRVGNRPDRVEPRAVKRRPNAIALLTKPRDEARADLLADKA